MRSGFKISIYALIFLLHVPLTGCRNGDSSKVDSHPMEQVSSLKNDQRALHKILRMQPTSDSIDTVLPWFWPRVKKLLGDSLSSFQDAMSVHHPTVEKAGYVIFQGCKPHLCPDEYGKIFIDTSNLQIHISWQVDSITRKFSENPASFPDSLILDGWFEK